MAGIDGELSRHGGLTGNSRRGGGAVLRMLWLAWESFKRQTEGI